MDLFAPGAIVLSTNAAFVLSGTSMATPHVSGLVLQLRAKESELEGEGGDG